MDRQLYFTFTVKNVDAVQIGLGTAQPVSLVNSITKEKGSSRYTVTLDFGLSRVVEGALKALQFVKAIEGLDGPYFVQPTRSPLSFYEPLHLNALKVAAHALQHQENSANQVEGVGPLCGDMYAILPYHDGHMWELRVLFSYGPLHDQTPKAARIWKIDDMKYELEWV